MTLPAGGTITGAGNTTISGRFSGGQSLPNTLAVWGTFGGATVKLQAGYYDPAGVLNWVDVPGATFTAAGQANLSLRADSLRINTAGGAGTSVNWRLL